MRMKPLERAHMPPPNAADIRLLRAYMPLLTEQGALDYFERERRGCEWWRNDLYQVEVRRYTDVSWVHLNIRRVDGKAIFRDWRHFQAIKNQLVGEECEGIELYPAESRLVDTSNKYHLYVCSDPAFRIPFGFQRRDVIKTAGEVVEGAAGYQQRPLEDE